MIRRAGPAGGPPSNLCCRAVGLIRDIVPDAMFKPNYRPGQVFQSYLVTLPGDWQPAAAHLGFRLAAGQGPGRYPGP